MITIVTLSLSKHSISMKNMKPFINYTIIISVLCAAYLAAGLPHHNFVPVALLVLLWLPGMVTYMNKSLAYRDLLVKKDLVPREMLRGSYMLSGFKTFEKSTDPDIEPARKDVITTIQIMALIFIFFTVIAIVSVYR